MTELCPAQSVPYLSHVPIAIFIRYSIGHLGSAGYPDCPVVRVNPSFARRGRKAETERQDAQEAPSPSGVVDHLSPLLTRFFFSTFSSADQANNQTSLLAEQDSHRNGNIRDEGEKEKKQTTQRKRGTEWEKAPKRGKNAPSLQTSAFHMGELEVGLPSHSAPLSLTVFSAEEEEEVCACVRRA